MNLDKDKMSPSDKADAEATICKWMDRWNTERLRGMPLEEFIVMGFAYFEIEVRNEISARKHLLDELDLIIQRFESEDLTHDAH